MAGTISWLAFRSDHVLHRPLDVRFVPAVPDRGGSWATEERQTGGETRGKEAKDPKDGMNANGAVPESVASLRLVKFVSEGGVSC